MNDDDFKNDMLLNEAGRKVVELMSDLKEGFDVIEQFILASMARLNELGAQYTELKIRNFNKEH
jgi:hypothetical protein